MIDEMRLVMQLAIGIVFLLSTPSKLVDPRGFARGVTSHQVLPKSVAYGVGLLLIPLEIFLAVSHLSGWLLSVAVPIGLVTIGSFATAVAINLKRGRILPCYCFGSLETISGRTLARSLLLFVGEFLLLVDPSLFNTSQVIYPKRIAGFSALCLALFWATFVLVAGSWLLRMTSVVELFRPWVTCGNGAESRSVQLNAGVDDQTRL
jgi:Methylamine utilisation protein MauE